MSITTLAPINHPHFNRVTTDAHPNVYESKATGMTIRLEARGASHGGLSSEQDSYVAIPAMNGGDPFPIHCEPLAWADDPWDVLDKVHALR